VRGSTQVRCALVALLVAVMLVPVAGAGANDRDAVLKDYSSGHGLTACRYTLGQLENVLGQLGPDINTYSPGLNVAIKREIQRWKDGGCKGKKGAAVDLRIVKISSKGGARSESVTLKNFGAKNVSLRRYVLRDASKHAIRFKKTTLKAGRSLVVVTGCRKGSKAAVRKGSRYYGCRKTQFWDDAGDIVTLVNDKGTLLSSKAYGQAPS
jgi:Lamin Tail Domain